VWVAVTVATELRPGLLQLRPSERGARPPPIEVGAGSHFASFDGTLASSRMERLDDPIAGHGSAVARCGDARWLPRPEGNQVAELRPGKARARTPGGGEASAAALEQDL
jgi:hypothetical protein